MKRLASGFTLLEAVIAMAIFAMGAAALYGWVNTNLIALSRADQITQRSISVENAIDFMLSVDPEADPKGEAYIGTLHISWSISQPAYSGDVYDDQNQKTINRAALYPAEITLKRDGKWLYTFEMSLLGVKKVREIDEVIFN